MRKLWNRPHGRHRPTRPPSAISYQAFNVPIRRSAVALLWQGNRRRLDKKYPIEGAAKARGHRPPWPSESCGWSENLARFCGIGRPPGPGDQSFGSRRRHSSTSLVPISNHRLGSSVGHLPIASQAAEPEMPTKYTADDDLVVRLHPLRAPTISVLVTTRERVGRTIEPKLRGLRPRGTAKST